LRSAVPELEELEFPLAGAGHVNMTWKQSNFSQPFYSNQLSDGILRLLWLVTILHTVPDDGLVLLDETELSLHPQWLMLVVSMLRKASARTNVLVATQSAELVRWLQPDELVIADLTEAGTTLTPATETKDLNKWLEEFSLAELWTIAEETAAEHGKVMHREDWGVVMGMHLADTKEQAMKDIRESSARLVTEYFGQTLGNPVPDVPRDQIVDYMVDHNQWIVGTPDDCIAGIERLQEITGGFGKFMIRVEDWAPRDKIHRSYELLARYVMPHFQGSLEGIKISRDWASERREALQENRYAGIKAATDRFDARRSNGR
ncbi:MAG: AAA family ATPase, partial [Chloroflexi bacterium]|nr:AAA family ATPase [Chloroflexota bacterium]